MGPLFLAFVVSLAVTLRLVRISRRRGHASLDHDTGGPQKFHAVPVPRIGGIGIFVGTLAGVVGLKWAHQEVLVPALLMLLCALPALVTGLHEDFTKNVSPRRRFAATALSALLAVWLLDSVIQRTDIPGLDWLVAYPIGATALTVTPRLASSSASDLLAACSAPLAAE